MPPPAAADKPTWLESAVEHEHTILLIALVVVPVLCWAWIVPMAVDMSGPMTGSSAWMMTPVWDARHVALLGAMWIVMMLGMMIPSAAPMLLMYAGIMRRGREGPGAAMRVYAVAAGYAAVWVGFSLVATVVQRALTQALALSPMMTLASPTVAAVVLIVAAVYQMTPIKGACLDACRSPIAFIMMHMKPGLSGAWRLGLEHGAYCLGCCWAMMLLLFVGGVMNIWVIVALTAFVLIEKLAPFGHLSRALSAAGLVAAAAWLMLR